MRNIFLWLLLATSPLFAQDPLKITVELPKSVVTEARLKQYGDSIVKKLTGNVVTPPVDPGLPVCSRRPTLGYLISNSAIASKIKYDAEGVEILGFYIKDASGNKIRTGQISPSNNEPTLTYDKLSSGEFTLGIYPVSCKVKDGEPAVDEKKFTVQGDGGAVTPPVTPPNGQIYELIANATGYGFHETAPYGLDEQWRRQFEKYKLDDGTWAITGVRIAVPWSHWEKTAGVYETAALDRLIGWCRERGLSLSLCFLPTRRVTDGFIPWDHLMKGNLGNVFYHVDIPQSIPGDFENPANHIYSDVVASYWSEQTNQKIFNAVKALSARLATYERHGYISLGTGKAEEYIMPNFTPDDPARNKQQLTDFGGLAQEQFQQWCRRRGIASYRYPDIWDGHLGMNNDIGKEWARFCTYALRRYFDNFHNAIKAGSKDVPSCYFMPAVGSPANASTMDGYTSYIAKNADEWYHTDGGYWDVWRKLQGIAVGRGTFPKKQVHCEYDPDDIGGDNGQVANGARIIHEFKSSYALGAQKVHLAMWYNDANLAVVKGVIKELREYVGKPFNPPSVTTENSYSVDITNAYFAGQWFYGDEYRSYVNSVAPGFNGGVPLPDEL